MKKTAEDYQFDGVSCNLETLSAVLETCDERTRRLVAGTVAKMVGSKVAEGTVNGLMIYRLGKATSKLLQPSC